MTTPAEQFLQATEELIAAKIASGLSLEDSDALIEARKRFLEVVGPNIAGVVLMRAEDE